MKRLLMVIGLSGALVLASFAPAQVASAHFEYGANCHIESVQANGTVVVRLTNRTYTAAYVYCGLRTNYGQFRWTYRWLPGRTWGIARRWIPGNWTRVWITHVHLYADA